MKSQKVFWEPQGMTTTAAYHRETFILGNKKTSSKM
jgi:hypothetical protein